MMWKLRQISSALWQYLNQPLFDLEGQSVWQPSRFFYLYTIQYLEACWEKDISSETHYSQ